MTFIVQQVIPDLIDFHRSHHRASHGDANLFLTQSSHIIDHTSVHHTTTTSHVFKGKGKEMDLLSQICIEWVWVKGHSGVPENEEVDQLAKGMTRTARSLSKSANIKT